jgi:cytochrome c-type biogenesis protein CcmH
MKRLHWILLLGFLLGLAGFSTVAAQTPMPPSDDQVNAIAKQMFCPVCESTPLDVCPTEACKQWRELIRLKLSEGWSEQQIKDYFVEQYGVRVLAEPPRQGFNWLFYVVPPVLLLAGVAVLYQACTSMRQTAVPLEAETEAVAQPAPAEGDEYLRRVEAELKKRN